MPASITPYLVCLGIGILNIIFAIRILCNQVTAQNTKSEVKFPLLEVYLEEDSD